MSLRDEVVRVLGERAARRINFNYRRVRVDAMAFNYVQQLLRDDEVAVEIDPRMQSCARYNRSSSPDQPTPTLYLWRDASVGAIRGNADSKALIVHECIHVLTHFRYGSRVAEIHDEITAYLAQTIYRLGIQGYTSRGSGERGGAYSRSIADSMRRQHTGATAKIFNAAQQIALDHDLLDGSRCTPLSGDDVAPLARALHDHPYALSAHASPA